VACPQVLSRPSSSTATCTPGRPARSRFSASVSLSVAGRRADAKSVLAVMGLGATSGQLVTVSAEGPDAGEAVAAVAAILGRATEVGT